jgi:hypothetical protein
MSCERTGESSIKASEKGKEVGGQEGKARESRKERRRCTARLRGIRG